MLEQNLMLKQIIVVAVCLFVFILYFKKEEKAISRFLTAAFHKSLFASF